MLLKQQVKPSTARVEPTPIQLNSDSTKNKKKSRSKQQCKERGYCWPHAPAPGSGQKPAKTNLKNPTTPPSPKSSSSASSHLVTVSTKAALPEHFS